MNLRSVSETHQTTRSSRQNIYKLSVEVIRRGESKRKSAHGSTSSVRCGKSSGSESYMCFCFFKLIFCVLLSVKNPQNVSEFQSSRVISFNCCGAVGVEMHLHVSNRFLSAWCSERGSRKCLFSNNKYSWRCFKSYHKVLQEAFNHITPSLFDCCNVKNELSMSTFIPTRTRNT